jgi:lipid-A-disaccharide synthase
MSEKKRIFIVAGEASGDFLGGALLRALREAMGDNLEIQGIGGEHMAAEGLQSLFPMQELSLMGFAEILPHAWRLMCRLKQTCDVAVEFRPDMLITIDSPGFNFRLTEWMRRCFGKNITCIHYVAPTVWAYKPKRAKKTAELYDHLMTILPFEPRYFTAYGLPTMFVGHPVVDDLGANYAPALPYQLGIPLNVALFAGSRKGEVARLLPIFRDAVTLLRKRYRAVTVSLPVTEELRNYVESQVQGWKHPPLVVAGAVGRDAVLKSAHVALTKTGTVTLEIAKYGVPMVATYRVNRLTAALLRRMLVIPFVNLINILSGKQVIPELLQEACTPDALYAALCRLIDDHALAAHQSEESVRALAMLQHPEAIAASDAAANIILSYLYKEGT